MPALSFRIPNGWTAFEKDWQEMLTAFGWNVWLTDEDGTQYLPRQGPVFAEGLRFDFHYIHRLYTPRPEYDADGNLLNSPVDRGEHVNLSVMPAPGSDVDGGAVQTQIAGYVSGFPWGDITDTDTTAYVHTLTHGTEVIVREITDEAGNIIGHDPNPETPQTVWG